MVNIKRRDFAKQLSCAALAGALSGCRRDGSNGRGQLPADTNVLLIILDTVGAEHVSSFGLKEELTPNIDKLASSGTAFQKAYSPAPWTKPAIASMFTGLMPNRSGMSSITSVLDPKLETLASSFKKLGYDTGAVVSHMMLQREYGYANGFDYYDERMGKDSNPHRTISSQQVSDFALYWLKERKSKKPFFLTTHYFDPHYNYYHHAAFDRTSWYKGPLKAGLPMDKMLSLRPELTKADIDFLIGLYREEIAFTDHHVGRLIKYLDDTGLRDNTLVVLLADHGEEFMEHGWIGHTVALYNELINVPLLFSLPGKIVTGNCTAPVSTVDLWQTLADLCGLEVPSYGLDGVSLQPFLKDSNHVGDAGRMIFSEVDYVPGLNRKAKDELLTFKTSMVMDNHKVIHDRKDEKWQLFDLINDPDEMQNLIGKRPFEESFKRELLSWENQRKPIQVDAPAFLKPAEIEKLKSLGYMK